MTLVLIALVISLGAVVCSAVFAVRRGLAAYRAVRDTLSTLGDAVADAVARLDDAPKHLDDAAAAGERLTLALGRLSRSRARLAVLTGALDDLRASLRSVGGIVPR